MHRPPNPVPVVTAPASLGLHDLVVQGREISSKELDYVATNTDFAAYPLGWHRHPGWELLCMLRGSSGYDFENGQQVTLSGGKFLLIPQLLAHRGLAEVREPSTICAVVLNPAPDGHGLHMFTPAEWVAIFSDLSEASLQVRPLPPALLRAARTLHETVVRFCRGLRKDPALATSIRFQSSFLVWEAALLSRDAPGKEPPAIVENARAFLEATLAQPFAIDKLLAATGCGRTRLFRLFKQQTGMSPVDWLQRLRVNKALELLQKTNRTLEDIASTVGLTSAPYLCYAVKRYTGRTPGQHRNQKA